MRTFVNIINPFHPKWHHARPHLITGILIVIALLVAFAAGAFVEHKHDTAAYFASHYVANLVAPVHTLPQAAPLTVPLPIQTEYAIQVSAYPAVGDQDGQGACAAAASVYDLSYAYRVTHPNHPRITFSWEWAYTYYSDKYSGGRDAGSWPDQDLEEVAVEGIPQESVYHSPQAISNPFSPSQLDLANAAMFKFPVSVQTLYEGQPSQAVVDEIASALSQGKPAMVALNVTPSYDNATATGGLIWFGGDEGNRGGHENVALKINPNMHFPNGDIGGIYLQNQWTKAWGKHGRAWVSFAWAAHNIWAVQDLSIGASATAPHGTPPPWSGMEHPVPPAPPVTGTPKVRSLGNRVGRVMARDRANYNLGPVINEAAARYGISAVGLLSTLGAECSLNTHSTECDRYGYWPDWSHGACQVSVETAGGFGVGRGTEAADAYVKWWENNPAHCINLAARVMASYIRYTGIGYPAAEVAWNCGPGIGNYAILNPSGQCLSNYLAYLGWWRWAETQTKT